MTAGRRILYERYLNRLPTYLQQLTMESNGKHVTLDDDRVACDTTWVRSAPTTSIVLSTDTSEWAALAAAQLETDFCGKS